MKAKPEIEGIFFGALSYIMWGIIPIYWKMLDYMDSTVILAYRVFWSLIFMLIVVFFSRKWSSFIYYLKKISGNQKKLWALFAAAVLISVNWGLFIWAVNAGRILDTSLGYYINPLISVLLGVTVLKEKLSKMQVVSVCLAGMGVAILTIYLGTFPWVSLSLAVSFGVYGLVKVLINADAAIGLTLETMIITPFALVYLAYLFFQEPSLSINGTEMLLLMGGGIVTALPLLLFAMGAKKIPLSMLGFLQYIAPTISLLIGVFIYHEAFTRVHLLSFLFIWSGLILYSLSHMKFGAKVDQTIPSEEVSSIIPK